MRYLVLLIGMFCGFCAHAQVPEPAMLWMKTWGGEGSDNIHPYVKKMPDGGFILSYFSNSNTGPITDSFCDNYLSRSIFVKYNGDGTIKEWDKCYLNSGDSAYTYIYPQSNGNFVLGGSSFGAGTFRIRKEDAAGNTIFTKPYGGSGTQILRSMVAVEDGGYVFLGESYSDDGDVGMHYGGAFASDIWVLKVDSNGEKVWGKVVGGSDDDQAAAIVAAPGNGCYIVGSTHSTDYDGTGNHGSKDVYVARLDAGGNTLWQKVLGGSGLDMGRYAVADGKGGIIVAAHSYSSDGDITHFITLGGVFWGLGIDSSGNIMWNNCYGGGGGNCYPNAVCRAADGSIWFAGVSAKVYGQIGTAYGRDDAWFVHTDSVGNFFNARVIGSSLHDRGMMIHPLSNGHVIAGGSYGYGDGCFLLPFNSPIGGGSDMFLTMFAPWDQTGIVENTTPQQRLQLYPNPTTSKLRVELPGIGLGTLIVTGIDGRNVYSQKITQPNGHVLVETRNWAKGLYLVRWIGDDGDMATTKLVIE